MFTVNFQQQIKIVTVHGYNKRTITFD